MIDQESIKRTVTKQAMQEMVNITAKLLWQNANTLTELELSGLSGELIDSTTQKHLLEVLNESNITNLRSLNLKEKSWYIDEQKIDLLTEFLQK